MLRTRLSKLLLLAGLLAAIGGCSGSHSCLTSRPKSHPATDCACIDGGACPIMEGAMPMDFGPYAAPQPIAAPIPYQGPMPQPGVPQLTPPPQGGQLAPYPQPMAPSEPYTPTKKTR